jgi:hypothetical protein
MRKETLTILELDYEARQLTDEELDNLDAIEEINN